MKLDLPISTFHAVSGTVGIQPHGVVIETPWLAGSYAAVSRLPTSLLPLHENRAAEINVRLKVEHGAIAIGILNRTGKSFLDLKVRGSAGRTSNVVLSVPSLSDASDIAVVATEGSPARVRLEAMTLTTSQPATESLLSMGIPLSDLIGPGRQEVALSGGGSLSTPGIEGAYVAILRIPRALRQFYANTPALILARLRVEHGFAQVGVLNQTGSKLLDVQELALEQRESDAVLSVPLLGDSSAFVVMGSGRGTGRVRIASLSVLIDATSRPNILDMEVPIGDFTSLKGERPARGPVAIDTPAAAWAFGAVLSLPARLRAYGHHPALVRIRLKSLRNDVGIGILNQDGSEFLDRKELPFSPHTRTVYLGVDNVADASSLVVYTDAKSQPGRLQIEDVTVSLRKFEMLMEKRFQLSELA
jgi:hypothetical protein